MLTWRAVVRRSARLNYRNKTNCKRLSSFVGGGQPAAKSSGTVEAHGAGLQMGEAGQKTQLATRDRRICAVQQRVA
jgi:hypothetical protein